MFKDKFCEFLSDWVEPLLFVGIIVAFILVATS